MGKISCQESGQGRHLNIRAMRKAAIQSQKSHMSPRCAGRTARSGHAVNRRQAMIRARRGTLRQEYVFAALRQGRCAACMVITSVVPIPGVWHLSRPAAGATACRTRGALGRLGGQGGTWSTGGNGARGGSSGRGSGPGEENAVPCIRKGTRRIIPGRRVSVSGETTSPWLSRYESLANARDLQMATLSDEICTESNIFGFVMT